ncbi:MAG: radical SAM protein [Muribaculaceae bacterium]|nr:radical SAM protein [Muribaculaceae bacterium]
MDKIKKLFLIQIPLSICNFRCHYCYIATHEEKYQGYQPKMKISPEEFGKAFDIKRIGGPAFANFCADGETLLTTDIDKYVRAYVEQGHYAEVVSNLTPTRILDKFLEWPKELLKRLEFKCSFHYLELKKRNLLNVFANNVKKIWEAGASANIEITPSDELIPYIEELKEFSMTHFGALPHVTVARDESTWKMKNLTGLSKDEYEKIWSQFDSSFWKFKYSVFSKRQKNFCYAGDWGYTLNYETGELRQCYVGKVVGNMYDPIDAPLPKCPIGRCLEAHCHNAHALMSLGFIPEEYLARYGDLRNRVTSDGRQWLQPEILSFFNSKLEESNTQLSPSEIKTRMRQALPRLAYTTTRNNIARYTPHPLKQVIRKFIPKK